MSLGNQRNDISAGETQYSTYTKHRVSDNTVKDNVDNEPLLGTTY